MNRYALMLWAAAVVIGSSAGFLWVHAASGPAPAPVMDLDMTLNLPSVVSAGSTAVSGTTSIVGGPAPAVLTLTGTDTSGQTLGPLRFQTVLKRDGTWGFNLPYVPVGSPGSWQVQAALEAGGKSVEKSFALTATGGDFTVEVQPVSGAWMFENDGATTQNRHAMTFNVSVTQDPDPNEDWISHNYTYYWNAPVNPSTGKELVLLNGGGPGDTTATYAAPDAPAGTSEAYVVSCRVQDEMQWDGGGTYRTDESLGAGTVTVRLLGDANGDGSVTVTDFSVWKSQNGQTGEGLAGDFNGDGQVTVTDFSLWKANNGKTVSE